MQRFLKIANLPEGQVEVVAVGEDYADELAKALLPFGIKTLICPPNQYVDKRLRSHIDLSVFHLGNNKFLLSKSLANSTFANELQALGAQIIFSEEKPAPAYPNDAFLCALSLGGRVFHNTKFTDGHIAKVCSDKLFHVNQGYAKCAVCVLNENAAISSDVGMISSMRQEGVEMLEIAPVGIVLEGYHEGFIGGATFKIAPNKLAFTGTLENHPSKLAIETFLKLHGITPIYLTQKPIFDMGSVIPVLESISL